uniref:Si:ch211-1e14.1 n=1 Tax=Myripristis murdjan TaxID=586833 RepID=A0A667YXC8_9TELE
MLNLIIFLSLPDEPQIDSTDRSLQNGPSWTGPSPSALPVPHMAFGNPDSTAATKSAPSPGAQPSSLTLNYDARTVDTVLFQQGRLPSQNTKSLTSSDLLAEGPEPLSTPPLSPSELVLGHSPQFEAPARLTRELKLARSNTAMLPSSQNPLTVPELQPRSNTSKTSLNRSVLTSSTRPQLVTVNPDQRPLDIPPLASSKHKEGESEQTLAIMTSLPVRPLEPPKLLAADVSHSPDYFFSEPKLPVKPSSKVLDVNQLSPSRVPMQQSDPAYGVHMLRNPAPEILAHNYVPFISPHPTAASSEPTEAFSEDFFPTNTMDVDWGSGDYMETMSFLGSEGDDYSLVTNLPSDMYDLEDSTESYDTSFPSRVGVIPSSMHPHHISPSPSLMTAYSSVAPPTSIHPSSFSSSAHHTLEPTPTAQSDIGEASDVDWSDTLTIEPTDLLLPDMNSLEYYTTQLTKENNSSDTGAEHRGNITTTRHLSPVSIHATQILATSTVTVEPSHMLTAVLGREEPQPTDNTTWIEDESSSDLSGFDALNETITVHATEETIKQVNFSEPFVDPSIAQTNFLDLSSSVLGSKVSTTIWSSPTPTPVAGLDSIALTTSVLPSSAVLQSDDVISSTSWTDVHWFITESVLHSTIHITPVLTPTTAFSAVPTEPAANATAFSSEITPRITTITTELTPNITSVSVEPTTNNTAVPPIMVGDQGVTEAGTDSSATVNLSPASTVANRTSAIPSTALPSTATATSRQTTARTTATAKASTTLSLMSTASSKSPTTAPTSRQYLCNTDKPAYLVKIGKFEMRCQSSEVVDPPPKFVFRAVSGPVVYTAISVINALRRSGRRFLSVSPSWTIPDHKYQVHTVIQFVPSHIDVRVCNFTERIERGLTMAFAEVRRRSQVSTNFTVQIVNITMAAPKYQEQRLAKDPVDITFAIRGTRGYLMGSEVSNFLMKLTMVEFSYYMGFPVLQIAEPFHYPELNTTQLLRSSWVRTVLLGVLDQRVGERTFQAKMERRLAMLLSEVMGSVRRVKRATSTGNSSVQVVSTTRLVGTDHPLEVVYFVEGPSGQRIPAVQTANLLNSLDIQRAAIVLGYRVQGILAQPVEKVASSPTDTENTNLWIVIGVVIPLLVVIVIISILYWKLCRTDKLEFQPDAMTSIQQRQKLQAPSVKGFDFAKLHLGQHSKDDVMVIQESVPPGPGPGPLSLPIKDGLSPSENGEILTPKSKTSSTKASWSGRRRGRSVLLEIHLCFTPDSCRALSSSGPPPMSGTDEQLSSASIFDHVDRMSRATDAGRRLPNKIQLIAMQPMPIPPLQSPTINGKLSDNNQINKEIQVALRHKSEIEHHRNKIRLRAKRKGHYDFPAMDDMANGFGDPKDQDRIYQKARIQIDKILDPDVHMPSVFMEPKKSGRGKRSPKQRKREQLNGGMMDADKDHLITNDSDATYRKCPGVNNVAYVVGSPPRSPSPTDDVFMGPASSPPGHAPPPPPYMPPQPSIEEARQQMHSLLDDAFALVSPTSQGSTAGITLPGVNANPPSSSPPSRGPRPWGPSYPALGPFPGRYSELVWTEMNLPVCSRSGLGSGYLPPGETAGPGEQLQPDSLYSSRGLYTDELPSSARPRPVGGTTGAQLHHLTQVGLSSRMNGYPAGGRAAPGQNGGIGWNHYHDDNFSKFLDYPDYSSSIFQMPRSGIREPSAPPAHLDTPGLGYPPAPEPPDTSPPTHSSASLIKAIREELLRLSQKQAAVPSYHS